MRLFVITILFLVPALAFSQKEVKLKKRYFGKYKGTVSSYKIDTGTEVLAVGESAIYINLAKEQISVTVGKHKMYGTYTVMFEADKYYLLDATIDGQIATERIMVYKRGRKIARDGMYPQPVTELKKYK